MKYILVKSQGLDDIVISQHISLNGAESAMRKLGGEPNSLFQKGMYITDTNSVEVIKVFGRKTIRFKPDSSKPSLGTIKTNSEGLTWEEWFRATFICDSNNLNNLLNHEIKYLKLAWSQGEDPTEYRAMGIDAFCKLVSKFKNN